MQLTTTLSLLRRAKACDDRYNVLVSALGGADVYGEDTPITILRILETNGLDDVLWALRAVTVDQRAESDRIAILFACDCAERILPVFEARSPDVRPREAIRVTRSFMAGEASSEQQLDTVAAARAAVVAARADRAVSAAVWAAAAAAHAASSAASDTTWAASATTWAVFAATWAVSAAGRATAGVAEEEWQAERLRWYLEGGEEVDYNGS